MSEYVLVFESSQLYKYIIPLENVFCSCFLSTRTFLCLWKPGV